MTIIFNYNVVISNPSISRLGNTNITVIATLINYVVGLFREQQLMVFSFVPKFVGQPEMKHNINLLLKKSQQGGGQGGKVFIDKTL